MIRVVILGATGQIGYGLAKWLNGRGQEYQVTAVRRKSSPLRFPAGIRELVVSALDEGRLARILEGADHVVYALGSPEQWKADPADFTEINVGLLKTFLSAMQAHPRLPWVYLSTFEVFSGASGVISESNPIADAGTTPYYQSMLDAYLMVKEFEAKRAARSPVFTPPRSMAD